MTRLHLVQAHEWLSLLVFFSFLVLVVAGLRAGCEYSQRLAPARRAHGRNRQAAEQRAAIWLREQISDSQYQQLRTQGYLEVASRLTPGRSYRLPAWPGRVTVYEAGCPIGQLCVIACEPVPQADLLLAQKWLIEADEPAYLALANWVGGPPLPRPRPGLEPREHLAP